MNQLRLIGTAMSTPISLVVIKNIDRSQFSIRSQPRQSTRSYNTTPNRTSSPLIASLPLIKEAAGMSSGDRYKAIFAWLLDGQLEKVQSDLHLEYLRQEHGRLLRRHEQIKKRRGMDVGCETALQTLGQIVNWRSEVVAARITQIEKYEETLKSTAKESP
ncbi:hypothetical protein Hte_001165 [Hypoxylon texense]